MAWIAAHPDMTEKLRIPDETGPEFELRFWPPKLAAKFDMAWTRLSADARGIDPVKDFDRFAELTGIDAALLSEMVQYGVKRWKQEDGGIACQTKEVEIDGRKHTVLSDESVEVLRVSHLLFAVALKASNFNRLTPEQKKTLNWRSPSNGSSSATSATSATEPSPKGSP